jgi:hypothetical protein
MSSALGAESLSGKTNKRGIIDKSDVYGGDNPKAAVVNPGLSDAVGLFNFPGLRS